MFIFGINNASIFLCFRKKKWSDILYHLMLKSNKLIDHKWHGKEHLLPKNIDHALYACLTYQSIISFQKSCMFWLLGAMFRILLLYFSSVIHFACKTLNFSFKSSRYFFTKKKLRTLNLFLLPKRHQNNSLKLCCTNIMLITSFQNHTDSLSHFNLFIINVAKNTKGEWLGLFYKKKTTILWRTCIHISHRKRKDFH